MIEITMPLKPDLSPQPTLDELRALHAYLSRPEEMPVIAPPPPPPNPEAELLAAADREDPWASVVVTATEPDSLTWSKAVTSVVIAAIVVLGAGYGVLAILVACR